MRFPCTTGLIGSLSFALLAAGGLACRSTPPVDTVDNQETPAPIVGNGSCDLDLTGDRGDHVFFLLGMRDLLGIQEGDDLVGSFYCNEMEMAQLFERRLNTLAGEQGLANDLRREIVQGCLMFFRSRVLADRLNSCYRYELRRRSSAPTSARESRTGPVVLNPDLFYERPAEAAEPDTSPHGSLIRQRALAYLAGVRARHHAGSDLAFTGYLTALVPFVASLLEQLGCRNIQIEHSEGLIPGGTTIRFEPSGEVDAWLRRTW